MCTAVLLPTLPSCHTGAGADSDRLMSHLPSLADAGKTVAMAELDMRMVAHADHGIDMGSRAGRDGGQVVCAGTPADVAASESSATAPHLRVVLDA